jgi:hypothetical protein
VVLHDVPPPTQVAKLAASRPPPGTLTHPLAPSTPPWRLWAPDTRAPGSDQGYYDQQQRQQQGRKGKVGSTYFDGAAQGTASNQEHDVGWRLGLLEAADHESGGSADSSASPAPSPGPLLPWWQDLETALSALALTQLPTSLPSLSYLLTGLPPCVALEPNQALRPLARLTRLRGLTLQAPGCNWGEGEAAQALNGLTGLRSLHLSVGAQGRALGGRVLSQLPYLPA